MYFMHMHVIERRVRVYTLYSSKQHEYFFQTSFFFDLTYISKSEQRKDDHLLRHL